MTIYDLLLALLANTAWAFNFVAGKVGMEHFPPLMFTMLRFLILIVLLFPFLRIIPGQMVNIVRVSLTLGVLHFSLMFAGLATGGDISSIAIALQLYVPLSSLLAVVFLHETMGWRRISGVAISFAGVMVIGFDPIVLSHLDALVLILGAALAMAVSTILMRTMKGVGVFTLQAWIALIAAPCLFVLSLIFEHGQWEALRSATLIDYGAPAYSAIGSSLIGHGIVYYLLLRYPVSVTAPFMLLTPVLAVLFGVTLWGDHLTWRLILGGFMTLLGVAVITIRAPKIMMRIKMS